MLDIIIDTLLDCLKLIPFLFVAFLIIELLEHKYQEKNKNIISKSGKLGPIVGSLVGAIPQCGFSVLATNLYITGIISLGTLISIYLSTSDEMLPILISNKVDIKIILSIILLKIIVGMCFGFIIDLLIKKKDKKDFHICKEEDCDCDESIIKSSIIHTLKTLLYILIVTLALNVLFEYVNIDLSKFGNNIFAPFITSLIGLIPNCASSVMITELYLNGVLNFGSMISGLLTGSGVGLFVLFENNKNFKENVKIIGILYLIGSIVGVLINFL